jgi:hypothetical protein
MAAETKGEYQVSPAHQNIINESDKQFGFWQLCPKCDGEKTVVNYDSGLTAISREPCGICNGVGVLARPVIDNNEKV